MGAIRSFWDLQVWPKTVEFSMQIYPITESCPFTEQYGEPNQMRPTAVTIPSNIAERFTQSQREHGRFPGISLGSLAKVETRSEIARRIGCLKPAAAQSFLRELADIGKELNILHHKNTG